MTQILNLISTREITMLKDIDTTIKINKIGKFNHFYIPNMEIRGINNFISKLEVDSVYSVIPFVSMLGRANDPYIVLSKQILISNNSSSKVIQDYLDYKLNHAIQDFGLMNLDGSNYFQLIFKYKKVTLDFSNLP
jgi:hypothetical protein